jgi:hypothetical protein
MATEINRLQFTENDPRHHTAKLKGMLSQIIQHAREDVMKIDDPRGRALFEVTAEVLEGLAKAFRYYEEKSEPAWR